GLLAFLTYTVVPLEQLAPAGTAPTQTAGIPGWILGLISAAVVFVIYGVLGLIGFWFARRLDLPGVFREGAGWRAWFFRPLLNGLALGVVIVVLDRVFAALGRTGGIAHPPFPLSIIASATAGIG